MDVFRYFPGTTPVFVSMPHVGLHVPDDILPRLTFAAQELPDTDWHIDRLYDWARDLGIGMIAATHSRYVVDLNRPPDDTPLYSGATTGLFPTTLFDGSKLYHAGGEPDEQELRQRLEQYWRPYHRRLAEELDRLKHRHGYVILFDAHSIRSQVPRLFDGVLPDFNLGSNDNNSADQELIKRAEAVCAAAQGYTSVLNGRFKGGYITRHYGAPKDNIHTLQLELSQRTYMDEAAPFTFREDLAEQVRPVLKQLLQELLDWRP